MKRYIPVSRVEGQASRQAHCDLPEGTYEREMSKEGFFGPAAFFYHRHPPTGWSDFTGPLRPRAFDLNGIGAGAAGPWSATPILENPHCRLRLQRVSQRRPELESPLTSLLNSVRLHNYCSWQARPRCRHLLRKSREFCAPTPDIGPHPLSTQRRRH